MPNTEHTPGPWKAKHNGFGDAEVIADCGWKNGDGTPFKPVLVERINWEDARLIAASPELLEACQAIADLAKGQGRRNLLMVAGQAAQAIAKATSQENGMAEDCRQEREDSQTGAPRSVLHRRQGERYGRRLPPGAA